MLSEAECKNSGGWFRDPETEEFIGPDFPRVVTCKPGEKWVQPAVCLSTGDIVKISGRCWNDDERKCYNEYRGKPSGGTRKPREPKPAKPVKIKQDNPESDEPIQVTKIEPGVASAETLAIIANCDRCLGATQISGLTYVLLTSYGSNKVYHIPKGLVSSADMERLCGGFA